MQDTIRLAVTLFTYFLLERELLGTWSAIVKKKESKARASALFDILLSLGEGEGRRFMLCTVMEA